MLLLSLLLLRVLKCCILLRHKQPGAAGRAAKLPLLLLLPPLPLGLLLSLPLLLLRRVLTVGLLLCQDGRQLSR